MTEATGILSKRIAAGKRDLKELRENPPTEAPRDQRVRREGAGRKRLEEHDPELVEALNALIDPETRGDPESPLRWTTKSTRKLASQLTAQGHPVGASKVRQLLKEMGYSLQGNKKTREGNQHPDRDAQFKYINPRFPDPSPKYPGHIDHTAVAQDRQPIASSSVAIEPRNNMTS